MAPTPPGLCPEYSRLSIALKQKKTFALPNLYRPSRALNIPVILEALSAEGTTTFKALAPRFPVDAATHPATCADA